MFRPFSFFILLPLFAGCAQTREQAPPPGPASLAESTDEPRGAKIERSGYATITDAPPAPFEPVAPGDPPPLTEEQLAGHRQFARAGAFQNQVMNEVSALDARLRREQVGNYVSLYYDNEGEPSVVFQFLRNGPGTLARYTRHPRFLGKTVRFSQGQLTAASDYMWKTFGPDRVLESTGIGRNSVTARVSVTEAEFRALAARKGATIPDAVELEFAARRPAAAVNEPLPAQIARLVRIFPRDDRPPGILHSIDSTAKVELRDGCFRASDREGALVLFPLGAKLFVDRDGYLAFGSETPGYGRVGETLIFPGSVGEVTAPELVGPIHAACGPGKVIKVNDTASAAARRAQDAVTLDANAVRHFRESYGLSERGALAAVKQCRERSGAGFCPMSPPPPVARQADCPAGTKLSHGLCRTPEGFVRPLLEWLKPFADE
jgi:hypothetical protein